jgi:hypothetical protein
MVPAAIRTSCLLLLWLEAAASPVSQSRARQPRQPLPGVHDFGQAVGEVFPQDVLNDRPELAVLLLATSLIHSQKHVNII